MTSFPNSSVNTLGNAEAIGSLLWDEIHNVARGNMLSGGSGPGSLYPPHFMKPIGIVHRRQDQTESRDSLRGFVDGKKRLTTSIIVSQSLYRNTPIRKYDRSRYLTQTPVTTSKISDGREYSAIVRHLVPPQLQRSGKTVLELYSAGTDTNIQNVPMQRFFPNEGGLGLSPKNARYRVEQGCQVTLLDVLQQLAGNRGVITYGTQSTGVKKVIETLDLAELRDPLSSSN